MSWLSLVLRKKEPSHKTARQGGFGLIELMISISIMAIVSAVILTQQSSFNGAVLLRNEAYDVALRLREVQLNAVGVSGDSGNFRTVLGVYFETTSPYEGEYKVFKDLNGDNFFGPGSEEFGEQGFLDERFEIREIRADGAALPGGGTDVSIVFQRPNFDATFYDAANHELSAATVEIDVARRGVTGNGDGVVRTVEVTKTGQIAVQ